MADNLESIKDKRCLGYGAAGSSRGYTYALSVILLSITLIALASLANEFRLSEHEEFAVFIPLNDAMRAEVLASSDLREALGASAEIEKSATDVSFSFHFALPFKKEGAGIFDSSMHAEEAALAMVGRAPFESILSAHDINGSNSTVMFLPEGGRVAFSNNGTYNNDVITIVHPYMWSPNSIRVAIECDKNRSAVGDITGIDPVPGSDVDYYFAYDDDRGSPVLKTYSSPYGGNVSYSVAFSDGSGLNVFSGDDHDSGQGNITRITYTKSPRVALILPFDSNITSVMYGAVLDYSPLGNNFTLGQGQAASAPKRVEQCQLGACYYFDGIDDVATAPSVNYTDSEVECLMPDRLVNSDFEDFVVPQLCDDGASNNWVSWIEIVNLLEGDILFDCTNDYRNGTLALKVYYDGITTLANERIYQQVTVLENAPYRIEFWAKDDGSGASAWFSVRDTVTNRYLLPSGSWLASETRLNAPLTTDYSKVVRDFNLPAGSDTVEISFYPADIGGAGGVDGNFYVDNATLIMNAGFNGGFEHYDESGTQDEFYGWGISGASEYQALATAPYKGLIILGIRQNGDPNSYIYSDNVILKNDTTYTLEFRGKIADGGDGITEIAHSIYDTENGMYLNSDGEWQTDEVILDAPSAASWTKYFLNFHTLPEDVGEVQVRFHAPSEASEWAYVDEATLTEAHDFTIVAWIKAEPTNLASAFSQIDEKGVGEARGFSYYMAAAGSTLYLASDNDNVAASLPFGSDGNWHHLALVVNRTTNYLAYVDGELVGSGPISLGTMNNSVGFRLGGGNASYFHNSNYFNGSIDDFRVYMRALNETEIIEHYNGKYQDKCSIDVRVSYGGASLVNKEMEILYNAELRARIVPPNPVVLMPFDANTVSGKDGAVADYSSTGALGTITLTAPNGIGWARNGRVGGAYSFNGAGFIRTPEGSVNFGESQFTISFWASGSPANGQMFLAKDAADASNSGFAILTDSGSLAYYNGSSYIYMNPVTPSWQHYAIVRNQTMGIQTYIDGVLYESGLDDRVLSNSLPFTIGASSESVPSNFLSGTKIDEVRIFNSSFTSDEVGLLYSDGYLVRSGLIAAARG